MRAALLLAMALAAGPISAAGPATGNVERIDVRLSNFSFEPSVITLQHGGRYLLHLRNDASGGHNFRAKAFFADAALDPGDRARVSGGKVELKRGEAVELRLTAPAAPGTYKVKCTHFLHGAFGMTGKIVVE